MTTLYILLFSQFAALFIIPQFILFFCLISLGTWTLLRKKIQYTAKQWRKMFAVFAVTFFAVQMLGNAIWTVGIVDNVWTSRAVGTDVNLFIREGNPFVTFTTFLPPSWGYIASDFPLPRREALPPFVSDGQAMAFYYGVSILATFFMTFLAARLIAMRRPKHKENAFAVARSLLIFQFLWLGLASFASIFY